MIWKTTDVVAAASVAKPFIQQLIQQHIHEEHDLLSPEECSFAIGIIGGGPKGLYAVEELLNRFLQQSQKMFVLLLLQKKLTI